MEDFLPASQEMEVAETVEIMEVTEDYDGCEESVMTESINAREGSEIESAVSSTTEEGIEIIDLSQMNECGNFKYFQDGNILGKNFSAILSGSNMTIKNLSEILNEDHFHEKIPDKDSPGNKGNLADLNGHNQCIFTANDHNDNNNNNHNQNYGFKEKESKDEYKIANKSHTNTKRELRYCYEYNINKNFDCELAMTHLQENCDLGDLLEAERRVLLQPVETLCHADDDGDTPLMIIVSKRVEENSRFYENVFAMQERLQSIRVCCQKPIEDFLDACPHCGRTDNAHFLTPLSSKNNVGDCALSCAMKMEHSEMVIDYLLAGLSRNPNDLRKVFDGEGILFFQDQVKYYPSLLKFLAPISTMNT